MFFIHAGLLIWSVGWRVDVLFAAQQQHTVLNAIRGYLLLDLAEWNGI